MSPAPGPDPASRTAAPESVPPPPGVRPDSAEWSMAHTDLEGWERFWAELASGYRLLDEVCPRAA